MLPWCISIKSPLHHAVYIEGIDWVMIWCHWAHYERIQISFVFVDLPTFFTGHTAPTDLLAHSRPTPWHLPSQWSFEPKRLTGQCVCKNLVHSRGKKLSLYVYELLVGRFCLGITACEQEILLWATDGHLQRVIWAAPTRHISILSRRKTYSMD